MLIELVSNLNLHHPSFPGKKEEAEPPTNARHLTYTTLVYHMIVEPSFDKIFADKRLYLETRLIET